MEFPLGLTDSEHRGGDVDVCPVEFPLSLTDLNATETTPGRVPCGVPPYSLRDSERHGGDTWTRALWSSPLAGRIWNTAEATPGRVPSGVPPQLDGFRTPRRRHLDACPVEFPISLTDSEHRGGDTWTRALWSSPSA